MPAPDLQLRQQVLSMRILPAHSAAVEGWLRPCLLVIVDARCDGSTDEPGYLRQNGRTMRKGTTMAELGRADSPTSEQFLRAAAPSFRKKLKSEFATFEAMEPGAGMSSTEPRAPSSIFRTISNSR